MFHCLEELAAADQALHLALGVFDGVHLGHQEVIARAVAAARRDGGLAGLLTFDPHPIRVIAPARAPAALLATLAHKARIAADLGVEVFAVLTFDQEFAAMEAATFVEHLTRAPVRTIAVGEDWRFGRNRSGDVALLTREASARNFTLEAVPPVMFEGDRISSTRIRQAIRDGNLDDASRMLGRQYSICAEVAPGARLGRSIGFPTANLPVDGIQIPPQGVWAVLATTANGRQLTGVANLGKRPTVDGSQLLLEVHLFDFDGDLYGSFLDVRFVTRLRQEMKFPDIETLQRQIRIDSQQAREVLAAHVHLP
jgi:riboflavin kinase/FMN adenylyltransferase